MNSLFKLISFVLFPRVCVGCGREQTWLCNACVNEVRIKTSLMRPETPQGLAGLMVVTSYHARPVAQLITLLKYNGAYDVVETVHKLIGLFLMSFPHLPFSAHAVIPVPLHRRRLRARGFNQAEYVAQGVATLLKVPVKPLLERARWTTPQATLSRLERQKNILGAFVVPPALQSQVKGRTLVVVDDVTTTGSTLAECAETLTAAGAAAVYGFVVAQEE